MSFVTREYTNKILELINEGAIDTKALAEQLLCWLSEHDVEEFYRANGYGDWDEEEEWPEDEETDEDYEEDFNSVGSPHHY